MRVGEAAAQPARDRGSHAAWSIIPKTVHPAGFFENSADFALAKPSARDYAAETISGDVERLVAPALPYGGKIGRHTVERGQRPCAFTVAGRRAAGGVRLLFGRLLTCLWRAKDFNEPCGQGRD
ncbi:MAG TPA: hypothetical protein VIG36_03540 [Methylocystis sp.]